MIALPPAARGRTALRMTAAAARGRFELQVCDACGATQYPPREVCARCLSGALRWRLQSDAGGLLALTTLRHSNDAYFRDRLPWRTGLVRLAAGPTIFAHVHGGVGVVPCEVRVVARLDRSGQAVLLALPREHALAEDTMMMEMACDPTSRKVLITDGESQIGQSLVRTLSAAGAAKIWVGHSTAIDAVTLNPASARVEYLSLDVTDPGSLTAAAARIGSDLDILINSHDAQLGAAAAAVEMRINYFGLLHLAERFAPLLEQRAAAGHPCAWVNLLSIDALSNAPARATYGASKAAAHSYTQHLRRQLQPSGIRVLGIYPCPDGRVDVGAAIVAALRDGVEDVFVGPIAQAWADGVREDPKVFERAITQAVMAGEPR